MKAAKKKANPALLWLVAACGALGGLLFGYDWVVIGGAKPFYELYFHLQSPAAQGWAMSCALVGCLLGSLVAGSLTRHLGRKRLLMAAAVVFAASSLGTALAETFTTFTIWRVAGGVAIGLASNLSPLYIAEIAPQSLRGRLVALNQMAIVLGIVLAQVANWAIAQTVPAGATAAMILASWNGQVAWRWMFAATAVPSFLFLVAAGLIPESPRWLAQCGRVAEADRVLCLLNGKEEAKRVLADLAAAESAFDGPQARRSSLLESLRLKGVRRAMLLGILLAVLQQWSGTNVIFNYAQEIFAAAGYQVSDILFNIVITGAVNVAFTLVALATIDRFGRRPLLLAGLAALAADYMLLGACYHFHRTGWPLLLLVLGAIALYAMSLAPATWVVMAEIFPHSIRGEAMGVATAALWIACFVLTYTFPMLNQRCGAAGTFVLYACVCAVGALLLYGLLPETRGRSLEEIEAATLHDKARRD